MAYEKKNIRAVIEEINSRKIYLPAIQRKYVWDDEQITRLMDSIMLGYPIGNDEESIWAVLDGQQRLTSIYIALQGSMSHEP